MYAAKPAAHVLKSISAVQWRILSVVERFMLKFEYVPCGLIAKHSKVKVENAVELLDRLCDNELLRKGRVRAGPGYNLTYMGYDMLALRSLSERDIIGSIGLPIAKGKESDVFDGLDSSGRRVAVKMFRIGRISFRDFKRLRRYPKGVSSNWLRLSAEAARREFEAYRILARSGIPVPQALGVNRHVVVTEAIEGISLVESPLKITGELLLKVIKDIRKMYLEARVVHNDLSPYNIILDKYGNHYFIDFPQWVDPAHPDADRFLERDIRNVVTFFKKRGVLLSVGLDDIKAYVTGKNEIV
jgi:RIO kinase 2